MIVQWLGLGAFTVEAQFWSLGLGTKILQVVRYFQKIQISKKK